jgi:hypothetical protein
LFNDTPAVKEVIMGGDENKLWIDINTVGRQNNTG